MPKGIGYVLFSLRSDRAGIIHVCDGDRLVGDDVAFAFEGCSGQVRGILEGADIVEPIRDCPPPGGALSVRFDFDIDGTDDVAVNVRK